MLKLGIRVLYCSSYRYQNIQTFRHSFGAFKVLIELRDDVLTHVLLLPLQICLLLLHGRDTVHFLHAAITFDVRLPEHSQTELGVHLVCVNSQMDDLPLAGNPISQ